MNDADGATLRGRCHCGAISFSYRTALPQAQWSVRECQCTFCRAHQATTTSDPAGDLVFEEHVPGKLNRYRFGQKVTDSLVCGDCGVYIGAMMTADDGRRVGIINLNALRPRLEGLPAPQQKVYEAETMEQRAARRLSLWTPVKTALRTAS